ncbi:MAG: hypothetical protein CMI09_16155 [Oceanospirillaceae bacterium]|nr:hypothetical protein [Oceanospirillaceae bacterium]
MRRPPSKDEVREQLNQEIEAFLQRGGEVHQVAHGETGLTDGRYDERAMAFQRQQQERTPVPEVVRAIEERREASKKHRKPSLSSHPRNRQPRKKIIYDDFGEPLRIVWE